MIISYTICKCHSDKISMSFESFESIERCRRGGRGRKRKGLKGKRVYPGHRRLNGHSLISSCSPTSTHTMSQHDLCGPSGETLERARELLHTVTVKTAPGTGFQLKDPAGRPAACALIASEQLKNTVVNPTSAQGSSCLNPAAF
ncbi:hypothetical protein EV361DRAFT_141754 [Lentinula raphanica]|nr:hypothetical protein EV361DRAFT_141754 [Lentinula raphanica]